MSVTGTFTVCDHMDVSHCAVVVLTTPFPGPVLGGKGPPAAGWDGRLGEHWESRVGEEEGEDGQAEGN